VYVYFSIRYDKYPKEKVVEIYEDIEHKSREAVFKYGGCISHHHGVGKLRKRFMEQTYSKLNDQLYQSMKQSLDPKNIFAVNNTLYEDEEEKRVDLTHKY
jgi:alkyldihydroxyacetonephosphate synthase